MIVSDLRTKHENIICDVLHDLLSFLRLKKRENHPWRSATDEGLLRLSHGCFLRFLNCANGTK